MIKIYVFGMLKYVHFYDFVHLDWLWLHLFQLSPMKQLVAVFKIKNVKMTKDK